MRYIPKAKLEVGVTYICEARNFTEGVWNGKDFDYIRYKWGSHFPDTELHWDEQGTVKPLYKKNK